jgi:CheY-like chemotaxis protein
VDGCGRGGLRQGPPAADSPAGGRRILVVDDNPYVRRMLCRLIERWGFAAWEAEDGDAALRFLQSERVSLVLTDYEMPRVDGLALLQALRAMAAAGGTGAMVPTIIVSADLSHCATRALAAGARAVFPKPIPFDLLRATIERLLSEDPTARA